MAKRLHSLPTRRLWRAIGTNPRWRLHARVDSFADHTLRDSPWVSRRQNGVSVRISSLWYGLLMPFTRCVVTCIAEGTVPVGIYESRRFRSFRSENAR